MSASVLTYDEQADSPRARLADYVELTKPRISIMVMVSVAITAYAAPTGVMLCGAGGACDAWGASEATKCKPGSAL